MKAVILQSCDGWEVLLEGRSFRYNHNDEDLGAGALQSLLQSLNIEVEIEECY